MHLVGESRYVLLGPPGVVRDGTFVPITGRRQAILFCLLALSVGGPVEISRLAQALWPDALPHDPDNALQSQVSRLRRTIGERSVLLRATGYELCAAPEQVDAVHVERLVSRARRLLSGGAPLAARSVAEEATALWHGEPMLELHDEELLRRESVRLSALRVDASVLRVQAELAAGLHEAAIDPLRHLLARHPLREDVWYLLVLALHRSQRTAEALDAYRDARRTLVRELGLEPGQRLRELERAILSGSPALGAPVHPCAAHAPVLAGGDGPVPFALPPPIGPHGAGPGWDQYPSTRLFLDRVRVVRPDFRPGPREAAQIVALCRLLDGDPLAIELAAGSAAEWGLGRLLARHSAARLRRSVREAGSVHDRHAAPPEPLHEAAAAEVRTDDEDGADEGSDEVLREPAM